MKYKYLIPLLVFSISPGYFNSTSNQQVVYAEKQQEKESIPFKKAEEYHIKGKFDDARNWYSMVVNDFPETNEAAESSFRRFAIDYTEIKSLQNEGIDEFDKARKYLKEAENYYSDFKYEIMKKADYHFKKYDEFILSSIKIVEGQFSNDLLNLKSYLKKDINAWKIPDIPADINEFLLRYPNISLDSNEAEMLLKNFGYNAVINELSTENKVDGLKVRYVGGSILYSLSENTTENGKKELEDVIKETENDPYNEIRYKAQKELKKEPIWKLRKRNKQKY